MSAESLLQPWSGFFAVTASSAAALTGLMFVVITLVMSIERVRRSPEGISAFSTPTVVHFGAALIFSAVLIAPWHRLAFPALIVGGGSLYELVYLLRVALRARRVTSYTPDIDDFVWYTVLPIVAYCAILAGAIGLALHVRPALFAVSGGVLLLIFIGIRNAWDVVTFLAMYEEGGPSDS